MKNKLKEGENLMTSHYKLAGLMAMSKNRTIGLKGKMPWDFKGDLSRFKELTMGHPIIMGRKTYDSIGRPLPGRTNIVIMHKDESELPKEVVVANSPEEAIQKAKQLDEEIFVIGGGQIISQLMDRLDYFYLTIIDREIEGDTFLPEFGPEWKEVKRSEIMENNGYRFQFVDLERKALIA
ncbi:MAG: type 3 dihydrofolate reductase [Candidatus Dojkabacteria bacterium]